MRSSYEIQREFDKKYSPLMDQRDARAYREAIAQAQRMERRRAGLDHEERVRKILK